MPKTKQCQSLFFNGLLKELGNGLTNHTTQQIAAAQKDHLLPLMVSPHPFIAMQFCIQPSVCSSVYSMPLDSFSVLL